MDESVRLVCLMQLFHVCTSEFNQEEESKEGEVTGGAWFGPTRPERSNVFSRTDLRGRPEDQQEV